MNTVLYHCPLLSKFFVGVHVVLGEFATVYLVTSLCLSVHTAMFNNLRISDGIFLKFIMLLGSFT